jgi:hypothetical protein
MQMETVQQVVLLLMPQQLRLHSASQHTLQHTFQHLKM